MKKEPTLETLMEEIKSLGEEGSPEALKLLYEIVIWRERAKALLKRALKKG